MKIPQDWKGCNNCTYLKSENYVFVCNAFPDGIPTPIASGDVPHIKVLPDQEGDTVWKKKTRKKSA